MTAVRYQDVLYAVPDLPHPLSVDELGAMVRADVISPEAALREVAGYCERCGISKASRTHQATCEKSKPKAAGPTPRQPWVPRPSRRAA